MKHDGDPFLGPHSGPKNGATQPKKRRQNVVSWLARALSRSTAGSLLTTCFSTFPADAPPSPPALHPLIDHAFVWHTHVQLLAMEGLLPLQKNVSIAEGA